MRMRKCIATVQGNDYRYYEFSENNNLNKEVIIEVSDNLNIHSQRVVYAVFTCVVFAYVVFAYILHVIPTLNTSAQGFRLFLL